MTAKDYLKKQGIHPTEPIYWYGDDEVVTLLDLLDNFNKAKLSNLRDEKDLDNVIDTLEKHNKWRRDSCPYVPVKLKMVSPEEELGQAIDKAIEILKTLKL